MNNETKSREEKIAEFINQNNGRNKRWCKASACGCLGCINGSQRHAWKEQHPNEAPIKEEEFEKLKA